MIVVSGGPAAPRYPPLPEPRGRRAAGAPGRAASWPRKDGQEADEPAGQADCQSGHGDRLAVALEFDPDADGHRPGRHQRDADGAGAPARGPRRRGELLATGRSRRKRRPPARRRPQAWASAARQSTSESASGSTSRRRLSASDAPFSWARPSARLAVAGAAARQPLPAVAVAAEPEEGAEPARAAVAVRAACQASAPSVAQTPSRWLLRRAPRPQPGRARRGLRAGQAQASRGVPATCRSKFAPFVRPLRSLPH